MSFHRIAHPNDLDSYVEMLRRLLANETESEAIERRFVRKDGSAVWGSVTASLVREPAGQGLYVAMVLEDIGERKLAEGRWSAVSWPEEYGGRGADYIHWLIFEEEYYRAGAPGRVRRTAR